ncbi:hypothetical protein HF325_006800 [Metschnikowia pulcherrima]|uniref:Uncharacterized protein n=1 Tax=Metschnikowia pulcherrima TaxID=27326 RepID=A0A8H7GKK8_9ASCO|nr:hypothetical protein HF325_006800 [Metschnikowia pulcherrima]
MHIGIWTWTWTWKYIHGGHDNNSGLSAPPPPPPRENQYSDRSKVNGVISTLPSPKFVSVFPPSGL